MGKKRIEILIPKALQAVTDFIADNDMKVKTEYKGYISSFGASIIQSGLYTAIAFYESTTSEVEKERRNLLKAIRCVVDEDYDKSDKELLMNYCMLNDIQFSQDNVSGKSKTELKEEIIDAAIAIKLAIRTFEIKQQESCDNYEE
ncbi:type III-B CRISPR module-associated protein Cmr5 [Clostridium sediminicola]|uniref:type III-B CRISPR module-associated protein Cmr5 n=1 Tax=Clostridium sediminicola TaxID=3114879 RepID=UPI0031F1D9D7